MYFAVLAVLFALFAFLHVTWKLWTSRYAFVQELPTIPWIGSVLSMERLPHKLFQQMRKHCRQYKGYCLVWLSFKPFLVATQVKFFEQILSSQELTRKSTLYFPLYEWLGTGLLTSFGAKWKRRRRVITPSFHFAILNDFIEIFVKHANVLANQFEKIADNNESIDVQEPVSLATLDVICETAMGVSIDAQECDQSEYVEAVFSMNKCLELRQRTPWYWSKLIFLLTPTGRTYYKCLNILHRFTTKVINDRIQFRLQSPSANKESDSKRKTAFLDMLLNLYDKGEIDVDGIREEVDTFMFEGHDTTAAGISWTLYLLGRHPRIQEKLHEEIDKISMKEGKLVDKIRESQYLDYVIKESLRLHPPVALFARVVEKDTLIDGNVVPKGTEVGLNAVGLHTNPEYWEEPDKFMPERFGDEQYLKRNPYAYVPFSAGPRNCIGQKFAMLELKIMLYHVMSKFRLESIQHEDEIEASFEIIHRSNNGLKIKFFTRN